MSDGIDFAKDYQKDSYNKQNFIEKIKMIKKISHTKKNLILFKMWN
jgi:hypothetical protein